MVGGGMHEHRRVVRALRREDTGAADSGRGGAADRDLRARPEPGEPATTFFARTDLTLIRAELADLERIEPADLIEADFVDLGEVAEFAPRSWKGVCDLAVLGGPVGAACWVQCVPGATATQHSSTKSTQHRINPYAYVDLHSASDPAIVPSPTTEYGLLSRVAEDRP